MFKKKKKEPQKLPGDIAVDMLLEFSSLTTEQRAEKLSSFPFSMDFISKLINGFQDTSSRYDKILIMSTFLHRAVTQSSQAFIDAQENFRRMINANEMVIDAIKHEECFDELIGLLNDQNEIFQQLTDNFKNRHEINSSSLEFFLKDSSNNEEWSFARDFREALVFSIQRAETNPEPETTIPDSYFTAALDKWSKEQEGKAGDEN